MSVCPRIVTALYGGFRVLVLEFGFKSALGIC